jgi:hypothetical protein
VAHPHRLVGRLVGEEAGGPVARRRQRRAPVLALAAPGDLAAELLGDELGAVADAEDRDAEVVDLGVEAGRPVDRISAAGRRSRTSAAVIELGTISE